MDILIKIGEFARSIFKKSYHFIEESFNQPSVPVDDLMAMASMNIEGLKIQGIRMPQVKPLKPNAYNNGFVLSDTIIKQYLDDGLLIENGVEDIQIQPNSIDITLGNTWKRLKSNSLDVAGDAINNIPPLGNYIDITIPMKYEAGNFDKIHGNSRQRYESPIEVYTIHPGEFVLMASKEILNIPNGILAFVCGRSSIARLGIQTEQAGLIDSGFRGTITFEVFNQTKYPIQLRAGMRFAQLYFLRTDPSETLYGKDKGSKYNDQIDATESKIHLDPELTKKQPPTKDS